MIVQAIAFKGPVTSRTDAGRDTELREFSQRDIRDGLAFDWAADWARTRGATHVIVCTPQGAHRHLSPVITIALK